MQQAVLLLWLGTSACWGYGFKGCYLKGPQMRAMHCDYNLIYNLTDFVRMFPNNITSLCLSKNTIRAIPPGSFGHIPMLRFLNLSYNQLHSLEGGEFKGLGLLKSLNLTSNNISYIHLNAFEGLIRLKHLLLNSNSLRTVPPGMFKLLPMIEEVSLSYNPLGVFSCEDAGSSATLKHLNLVATRIRKLNLSCFPALEHVGLSKNSQLRLKADTFGNNRRLKSLALQGLKAEELAGLCAETKKNLSQVSFSVSLDKSPFTICGLFKDLGQLQSVEVHLNGSKLPPRNLLDCATPDVTFISDADLGNVTHLMLGRGNTTQLSLIYMGLREISRTMFAGYRGLKILQLSQNDLIIQPDTFQGMTNLTILSLDENNMRDIDPRWFTPLNDLTVLSLTKNLIADLKADVFRSLANLEELYLQYNLLKCINNKSFRNLKKLKKLNIQSNIIHLIQQGSFQDLVALRYMDLSGNRIMKLTPSILSGLVNLQYLNMTDNHLNFRLHESPFTTLTSLRVLRIQYQGPGRNTADIGPQFFQGLSQLISVSCGQMHRIDFDPGAFLPLAKLEILKISSVALNRANLSLLLSPLKALKKLTLDNTDLDSLPSDLLPPGNSLEVLKVQNNHLHTIDKRLLDILPRLCTLQVSENPITCGCENAWFKNWAINNTYTQVPFVYSLRCNNDRSAPFLWEFNVKACSHDTLSFALFIATFVTDALFVCVCLTWHMQGSTLRYLRLLLHAKLGGRQGAAGTKFQYDAFISYSSQDEDWVMRNMVPHLENPAPGSSGLKLCLHHRDFRPGTAVLENIEAAIYSSRHTICVVSHHFLRSEWCSLEFQLATLRLLCDGSDVVVLVFLEEIPEHCLSLYTRLRKVARKRTYLLWPEEPQEQDVFWARLTDALKDNKEEQGGGDTELLIS